MNWKLRLMNKPTLTALLAALVAFVYQTAGLLGLVPSVSQDAVIDLIGVLLNILVAVGILVDPTTPGIYDSTRAMNYDRLGEGEPIESDEDDVDTILDDGLDDAVLDDGDIDDCDTDDGDVDDEAIADDADEGEDENVEGEANE